jgi:hypothetical protein
MAWGGAYMSDFSRRYYMRDNRISFGYYDDAREAFDAQVDLLGIGTPDAVLVTDMSGSVLLATNPDLTCELPYLACWCFDEIIALLEVNGFIALEKEGLK